MKHLSIDIGGTKIRVVVYSLNNTIKRAVVLNTADFFISKNPQELDNLLSHIKELLGKDSFDKVGISFNCLIKSNKVVYSSLMGGSSETDLELTVKQFFKFNHFNADNDVVCMARAELKEGVGKGKPTFLYVNLGTGIRLVCVEKGQIIIGESGSAGEISQTEIWVEETKSYIKADLLVSGQGIKNLSQLILGKELTSEQVFNQNNEELINIFTKYLSKALTTASYFYNPKIIVFGGSLINSADKWLSKTRKQYLNSEFDFLLAEDLVTSKLQYPASLGAILFD